MSAFTSCLCPRLLDIGQSTTSNTTCLVVVLGGGHDLSSSAQPHLRPLRDLWALLTWFLGQTARVRVPIPGPCSRAGGGIVNQQVTRIPFSSPRLDTAEE